MPILKLVNEDNTHRLQTKLLTGHLKRGFFVGKWRKVTDEFERVRMLNRPEFMAENTALVEEKISTPIETPDSSSETLIDFSPNRSVNDEVKNKTAIFLISEVYYPPGWKILLDGQLVSKIYKTDHALMPIG